MPRPDSACGRLDWRVALERHMAAKAKVPVLRSWEARLARPDAHPGIQNGGDRGEHSNFDCSHSSFGAGAYDAEVQAFIDIIRERWTPIAL